MWSQLQPFAQASISLLSVAQSAAPRGLVSGGRAAQAVRAVGPGLRSLHYITENDVAPAEPCEMLTADRSTTV
jgi:hypothetical protein